MAASSPISFARGAPAPELIPSAELADCARAAAERDGAERLRLRARRRLRAATRVGRGTPRRRTAAGRTDDGRAPRIRALRGRGARAPTRSSPRGGPDLRPAAADPRSRGRRGRIAGDGRRGTRSGGALERELARSPEPPSFLYTIPTFQNPSGRTLSAERRGRIAEIAETHRLPVLEDDPYGLVRYEGEAEHALCELMDPELVTYTSSFSKTVAPGLRTGYFVLPAGEAAAFEQRAVSTYISPPFLTQATIAEFVDARPLRAEPRARVRASCRRGATRCSRRSNVSYRRRPGAARRAGTSSGWSSGRSETRRSSPSRAAESGVGIVRGEDFFPPGLGSGARPAPRLQLRDARTIEAGIRAPGGAF